jgi:Tol biopolymer transport system component
MNPSDTFYGTRNHQTNQHHHLENLMKRFKLALIVFLAAFLLQSCSDGAGELVGPAGSVDQVIGGGTGSTTQNGGGTTGEARLVFASADGPNSSIMMVKADGSDLRRLTNDGDHIQPVVSPKGDRIAYRAAEGVYVMNVDGTNQILVGEEGSTPSWSADGTKLIYTVNTNGNPDIWVVNADGTGQRRLTTDPGRDFHPFFSPDGRQIAFLSDREQSDEEMVFVMNADGSNQHRVSNDVTADLSRSTPWSPDGRKLLFNGEPSKSSPRKQVYIVNVDGTSQRKLTAFPVGDGSGDPCWSPDGRMIAFAGVEATESNIFSMKADGTNQQRLTSTGVHGIYYPTWSPDGRFIAYTQNGIVKVMNADGTNLRPVSHISATDDSEPMWGMVRMQ